MGFPCLFMTWFSLWSMKKKTNQVSLVFIFMLVLICILHVSSSLVTVHFHQHDFPVCSLVTRLWWTHSKQYIHRKVILSQLLGCNSSAALVGAVFLLNSTSHPQQRFLQGSSPLSQSDLTACPGTPCHQSAQQHTGLSDGPPGHGPSNLLWRHTPSGCPAGGAVEHRCQSVNNIDLRQVGLRQSIITTA